MAVCPSRPSRPFLLLLWCRMPSETRSRLCCPCRESSTTAHPSPSSASPTIISKRSEPCLSESLAHDGVPHRSLYFLPLLLETPGAVSFSSCQRPETSPRDSDGGSVTCSRCWAFRRYEGEEGCCTPDVPSAGCAQAASALGDPQDPFECVVPVLFYPHSLCSPISCLLKVLQTSLDKFT